MERLISVFFLQRFYKKKSRVIKKKCRREAPGLFFYNVFYKILTAKRPTFFYNVFYKILGKIGREAADFCPPDFFFIFIFITFFRREAPDFFFIFSKTFKKHWTNVIHNLHVATRRQTTPRKNSFQCRRKFPEK